MPSSMMRKLTCRGAGGGGGGGGGGIAAMVKLETSSARPKNNCAMPRSARGNDLYETLAEK